MFCLAFQVWLCFSGSGCYFRPYIQENLTVGTPVTQRPPHSPGRAVFPHPVLRLYSLSRKVKSTLHTFCSLLLYLLFPAVRFAHVIPALHVRHEFPLWATYFRQVLPLVHGFPMLCVLCLIRHPIRL